MNGLISLEEMQENIKNKNYPIYIPAYQRGYRWQAEHEVKDLLDDLEEFFKTKVSDTNYYCLQPIVVKDLKTQYNILDGQQRLTTLYLIYKVLFKENMFDISYQTRKGSAEFLADIESKSSEKNDNIDFYHFYEAYRKIKNYFEDNKNKELFKDYFLDKIKVIWYEVDKEEDEKDVFLRLNIGKIPLTNAELVKALFLSKSEDEDMETLKERAELWYKSEIETRKNNDKAYCLFNNIDKYDIDLNDDEVTLNDDISRIEMFFSLLSGYKNSKDSKDSKDKPQAIFKYYYDKLKNTSKESMWNDFKICQQTLLKLANPRTEEERKLYHYIGFLINSTNFSARALWKDIAEYQNISLIKNKLKTRIKEKFEKISPLEELNYLSNNDKKNINNLLLLFNLEDLNQNKSNQQDFDFSRYKMQNWSLEHIIPQSLKSTKDYNDPELVAKWLEDLENFIPRGEGLKEYLKNLKESLTGKLVLAKHDIDNIKNLVSLLDKNQNIHSISNLVLLDRQSNSKLQNKNFSKKRKIIEELRNDKKLVPQCTAYVFMKAYSEELGDPDIWTHHDREMYLEKIQNTLKEYI